MALVESLSLAKKEALSQGGGVPQERGHYPLHMGAAAVDAGLENGTLLKVSNPLPPHPPPPLPTPTHTSRS